MKNGLSGISSFFGKTAAELGEYNEAKMIESFLNSFLKDENILEPWITMNIERQEIMCLDA